MGDDTITVTSEKRPIVITAEIWPQLSFWIAETVMATVTALFAARFLLEFGLPAIICLVVAPTVMCGALVLAYKRRPIFIHRSRIAKSELTSHDYRVMK